MDIADAIEKIVELAKGSGPVTVPVPNGPKHAYLIKQADGNYLPAETEIGPVDARSLRLDTLTDLANGRPDPDAAEGAEPKGSPGSELWLNVDEIVMLPHGPGSRDRVTMGLVLATPRELLRAWGGKTQRLSQRALYTLLRTTLADCIANHPTLPRVIGKIDVKRMQATAAEVTRGKVSLDRSMRAEVEGLSELPDEIVLSVPLFARPVLDARAEIRVAIELDPEREEYVLDVIPGEIERADEIARQVLTAELSKLLAERGKIVPIYHGRP